ncbi:MAG: L-lysine 6-transaminase [Anaerolineales bacterium]
MQPSQVHSVLNRCMLVDGEPIVVDLERSHGSYLVDALTGREYIDFFTYFASLPVGHNHPGMREPGFLEKITQAALVKPSCSDFYTTLMAEFVDTFHRVAMPDYIRYLFLISGGALAVENALKVAFDWKFRRNLDTIKCDAGAEWQYRMEGWGTQVIHFHQAFHGRSGYTLSLTNTADPRKYRHFPKFDWPRITNPKLRFPLTAEVLAEVRELEERAVEEIERAVKRYCGDIAALIVEPLQAEGGDNHFRPEFMRELRRLADEHDFLFILDEVQTGMGITGEMWAIEHTDVQPDIIAFGKKAQVCGIMVTPRVDEVQGHCFQESSRINSTWGGNLVDMVRATRYLEIVEEESLVENAARMGERLLLGLRDIASQSAGFMTNVRGKGLMLAFDLPDGEKRDALRHALWENGLYALKCGPRSVRFRPTLDVSPEVVDKALEIVAETVLDPDNARRCNAVRLQPQPGV